MITIYEYENFRNKIREGRIKSGIGLRELARRLEVSGSYIFRLENGRCGPSEELIAKLSDELNIDCDDLMISAGRIPSDICKYIIQNPVVLKKLRRDMYIAGKIVKISGNRSEEA